MHEEARPAWASMKLGRRHVLWGLAVAAILFLIARACRPVPVPIDVGVVERGRLRVTVDDDGRTRVRERYTVSAPILGRLLRTPLEPGDRVQAGQTVVAEFAPITPDPLDPRRRAEAQAEILRSKARLREAEALREQAQAELELARSELDRTRALRKRDIVAAATLEQAVRNARRTEAGLRAAEFQVQVARFELDVAEASLREPEAGDISPAQGDHTSDAVAGAVERVDESGRLALRAPVDGQVLRVFEESARTLPAGTAILEIGNTGSLEVVADYLSQDAVQIEPGMSAFVAGWSGLDSTGESRVLGARVRRVEPAAFTKVSALGVEEQRVNVVLDPGADAEGWSALGDGYRVEVRIILWEQDGVLIVPAGALFRKDGSWAAFAVEGDRARLRTLEIGRRNGLEAQVLAGLEEGERVILYPGDRILNGAAVEAR